MKNFEDLSFSDSYMFYAILRKRADLCLQIVELITGRKVASIRLLHAEHDVRITYRSKGVRFDVEFQDERGTAYDLEMQVDVGPDLLKRGRYYRSSLDLEQLKPGEGYQKLRDSFIIFICKSDPFGLGLPRYDIEATCLQDDRVQGDGSHLIFLNASPFKEDEDPEMQAFLNYVADGRPTNALTASIDDAMQAVRLDEETRGNYMTLQEMIDIEKAEARRDGLAEGLAEGRVEGLAEGRAERQDEIARLLGYSPEDFERFLREKKESQSSCEKD